MAEVLTLTAAQIIAELEALADPERAKSNAWFFKSAPGQYGEGDQFLGIRVPQTRVVARKYQTIAFDQLKILAKSKWHEARLCAMHILVEKYRKAKSESTRKEIFEVYLGLLEDGVVNNWDLVDSSAPYLGDFLISQPGSIQLLGKLAGSSSLWDRRASVIFTAAFIRNGQFDPTLKIASALLSDSHDLIHKAVGWMLREVGNRDLEQLRRFLTLHSAQMPRTMLRYSIEKFSEDERKYWLSAKAT